MYKLNMWGELIRKAHISALNMVLKYLLRTRAGLLGNYIKKSIIKGDSNPLILKDTRLPVEMVFEIPNTVDEIAHKEMDFFFGDNESALINTSLGRFILHSIPAVPKGPLQLKIKVSVTVNEELYISVVDPLSMEYRSVGYVDLSMINPPKIVPSQPSPNYFNNIAFNDLIHDLIDEDFLKKHPPRAARDITRTLAIHKAAHGVNEQIEIPRFESCPACTGSGVQPGIALIECSECAGRGLQRRIWKTDQDYMTFISACPACDGTGQQKPSRCAACQGHTNIESNFLLTINIPPGIDTGAQICLPNQGEPGQYGGPPGHLYVVVIDTNKAG
jgi:hypothetical protein